MAGSQRGPYRRTIRRAYQCTLDAGKPDRQTDGLDGRLGSSTNCAQGRSRGLEAVGVGERDGGVAKPIQSNAVGLWNEWEGTPVEGSMRIKATIVTGGLACDLSIGNVT